VLDKSLRCFLLLGRSMGNRNFVDCEGATLDRIRTSGTFIVAFLKGFSEYEVRNLIRGVKIMAYEFSKSASALIVGMVLSLTPAQFSIHGPEVIGNAFAKQAGNGNGNSGGNGNGSGGSGSASNSSTPIANAEKPTKLNHGSITSQLGALNAAHASAKAFANASPNSRIGKIKAYYIANQLAVTAATTAGLTDAAALRDAFEGSAPASVLDAYEALQANPTDPALQVAYANAVSGAGLLPEQTTAMESAYSAWKSAADDDALAESAAADAEAALDAAANKSPVSPEARIALDALLVGKIE
jgi:hypothetical protein